MFQPYLNNNVITHHSNLSTTFQATIIKTVFFNSTAEGKMRNFSKPFAKNNWFSWTFRYLQALIGISPMEYHNTIKTQATICLAQQVSTFKPWPSTSCSTFWLGEIPLSKLKKKKSSVTAYKQHHKKPLEQYLHLAATYGEGQREWRGIKRCTQMCTTAAWWRAFNHGMYRLVQAELLCPSTSLAGSLFAHPWEHCPQTGTSGTLKYCENITKPTSFCPSGS